eukprot:TRINITY_DN112069_c0_g1_i1.p1 TRINITY_DN112069_c0_g1~~TRINITY_DN112069_c0_g1_i1.p1  ORF type:complete len:817 (+),score=239.73 TRINITY_DN112069_c0_g1_i1:123-2573(+)
MGIQNLLQFLKPVVVKKNIRDFSGKSIGVDAMCWMHKGAFACSQELVTGTDTDKFIHYFIKQCEVLRYHKIKPIIVFDGGRLPAKQAEEKRRQDHREAHRVKALDLMQSRDKGEVVSQREIDRACEAAIRITGQMISRLMGALEELAIDFIVSPYEADAQLAYMCRAGWIDCAISEDSDLLAYGCPNTFFKMTKEGDGDNIQLPCLRKEATGADGDATLTEPPEAPEQALKDEECEVVEAKEEEDADDHEGAAEDAAGEAVKQEATAAGKKPGRKSGGGRGRGGAGAKAKAAAKTKAVKTKPPGIEEALASWSTEKFAQFCVLCGTDYKEKDIHIKGFGIKTIFDKMCEHKNAVQMLDAMRHHDRWKDKFPCEQNEFLKRFNSVVAVFLHHVVFDLQRGDCISIASAFPGHDRSVPGIDLPSVCGQLVEKKFVQSVARGKVDPRSKQPRVWDPLTPAERQTLDRLIEMTRRGHRQLDAEDRRKKEGAAIAAERAERAEAARAKLLGATTAGVKIEGATAASPSQVPGATGAPEIERVDLMDDDEEEEPPKEVTLRGSDVRALLACAQVAKAAGGFDAPAHTLETPPRAEHTPSVVEDTPPHPMAVESTANPFARKRANEPVAEKPNSISKRQRLTFAEGTDSKAIIQRSGTGSASFMRGGSAPSKPPKASQGSSSSSGNPFARRSEALACQGIKMDTERRLLKPTLHPRGGYAAEEAARTLLAHKGVYEYEKVSENEDKSKLKFYLGGKDASGKKPQPEVAAKRKTLAEWNARPWEDGQRELEEEAAAQAAAGTKVGVNLLSDKHNRVGFFRRISR